MGNVTFYQYSDNFVRSKVKDKQGNIQSPGDFPQAEYALFNRKKEVLCRLTLNEGITTDGDDFVIHIEDNIITSDVKGSLQHQLVVWNSAGDKLPPVFIGNVKVKSVLPPA